MDNIYNYFNITSNYTIKELNTAYKYKIEILKNLDLSYFDKKILLHQYNKMYRQACNLLYKKKSIVSLEPPINKKLNMLDNFFNNNNNNIKINHNIYSYKEKLLPNGEIIVNETKQNNDHKSSSTYIISKYGEKRYIK